MSASDRSVTAILIRVPLRKLSRSQAITRVTISCAAIATSDIAGERASK